MLSRIFLHFEQTRRHAGRRQRLGMQAASPRKKGSRGTSCRRLARCRATLTAGNAGGAGRLAPQEGIARDFLASPSEMPGDVDGRECRQHRPARRDCAGLLVVAGRHAGRRRRPGIQAASSRKKGSRRTSCRRQGDARRRRRQKVSAAAPHAESARGLCRRRGDAGRRQRPKVLAASLRVEVVRDFLASLAEIPSDGNGRKYRPPWHEQKPRGDFCVAKEMPGDGDGQRCWPPRPA